MVRRQGLASSVFLRSQPIKLEDDQTQTRYHPSTTTRPPSEDPLYQGTKSGPLTTQLLPRTRIYHPGQWAFRTLVGWPMPPGSMGNLEKTVGIRSAGILLPISFLDSGPNLDCSSMPDHEPPHPHAILQPCSELSWAILDKPRPPGRSYFRWSLVQMSHPC